jgi:hypothetical protein
MPNQFRQGACCVLANAHGVDHLDHLVRDKGKQGNDLLCTIPHMRRRRFVMVVPFHLAPRGSLYPGTGGGQLSDRNSA